MASSVPGRREKLSEAAHLAHPIHAPLSDASVSELIEAMQFRPGDRVVDIGCGTGEWLFRIATATGTAGLGLDTSKAALRLARMRSRQVSPAPSFQAMDAAHWHPDTAFQHALCVGSTHALGGLQSTSGGPTRSSNPMAGFSWGTAFGRSPPHLLRWAPSGQVPPSFQVSRSC